MARVLAYVVCTVLGVWLGGLFALILFVSTLFVKARGVAADAAPVLFNAFETYQMTLAAVALLALVLYRWSGRNRFKTAALALTLAATVLAVVQIGHVSPTVNAARNTDRPTFDRYHRLSTVNYTAISGLVLAALVAALAAGRRPSSDRPHLGAVRHVS